MFATTPDDLDMHVIYDVSHNIAKVEEHVVDGKQKTLLVHRKGSTRAFPPHHPLIPVDYQVYVRIQTHHSDWGSFLINIISSPADRPASTDRRDHGNLQLCSNGDRTRHDWDIWNHMPRGGMTPDTLLQDRMHQKEWDIHNDWWFWFSGPCFVTRKISQESWLPGCPGQTSWHGNCNQSGFTKTGYGGGEVFWVFFVKTERCS